MKKSYLLFFWMIMGLAGCESESLNPANLHGTYQGTFIAMDLDHAYSKTGSVTLVLHQNGYECSGNPNLVPAGGEGAFVETKESLEFRHHGVFDKHVNMDMVLTGAFTYDFDGTHLNLWKNKGPYEYRYELKKIK